MTVAVAYAVDAPPEASRDGLYAEPDWEALQESFNAALYGVGEDGPSD